MHYFAAFLIEHRSNTRLDTGNGDEELMQLQAQRVYLC